MNAVTLPVDFKDPVNAQILAISEDRVQGFQRDPMGEIARLSEVPVETVLDRIRAMTEAGTIRRVRQTLLATNLAQGALVAWQVPQDKLDAAFDFMFQRDPFSGHVVTRSTDAATPGSSYKLWTTLKVPQGYSLQKHGEFLAQKTGAEKFVLLPAKNLFALGVGHTRRRGLEPGSKADVPAEVQNVAITTLNELEWRILTALKREFRADEIIRDLWRVRAEEAGVPLETFLEVAEDMNRRKIIGRFSTVLEHVKPLADGERVTRFNALFHWAVPAEVQNVAITTLNDLEWRILTALKREFRPEEIVRDLWRPRAEEAGVPLETFLEVAEDMNRRKIIGRFSTFLEHVKPQADGERVTRFNALFHWAVPAGREVEAGREVGRHHIMTHAYWREGGPEFRNVNIMGVAHGTDKTLVLAHKAAIDAHLASLGIAVSYTNVFWGGRSEIKPSEIAPAAYREWCVSMSLDPETMRG